jgi:fibronectin type 3 domain-containing protein
MAVDREFLERVYDKLEAMSKDMAEMKVSLAEQKESIKYHIYRTDLAEQNIELLRQEQKPIQEHVVFVSGAMKFIGAIALIAGLAGTILGIAKGFGL